MNTMDDCYPMCLYELFSKTIVMLSKYRRLSVFLFASLKSLQNTKTCVKHRAGLLSAKSPISRVCIDVCCSDTLKKYIYEKMVVSMLVYKTFPI